MFISFFHHASQINSFNNFYFIVIFHLRSLKLNLVSLQLRLMQKSLKLFFFSFFFSSFLALFLEGLAKFIFSFFSDCYFKRMWPRSESLIWYSLCFQVVSCRNTQLAMVYFSDSIWNLSLQPVKLYPGYHNVYGHQNWQSGDLPWGATSRKVTGPFDHVASWNQVKN